ncbi:CASP-like protein 4A4 [Telopea speciosissima]|uniref:CASP-like protein 4A4 n=1 Tax=Telopea speciosissima TaxID=54955 RepID=UPI001CC6F8B8|nr:CASP-like protein 4A4 [Telopea speciosissima]
MAAGSSPSPRLFYSPAQLQYPTPSPFTYSIGSTTTWSSTPTLHRYNLFIRSLGLLFSFVSAISLASPSPNKIKGEAAFSFGHYPELRYSFGVTILASGYSASQLFKGVCDIVHKGLLISDLVSDYLSFILDNLLCYLLISSSSMLVSMIQQIESASPVWKATIVSMSMSFIAFLVFVACSLLSGYKLCKRIIW